MYIPNNNMRGDDIIILVILLLLLYSFAYVLYSYLHNIIIIVHRSTTARFLIGKRDGRLKRK